MKNYKAPWSTSLIIVSSLATILCVGNGGLFSFTGFFRNKALGTYRAFVTDPRKTVVLHFPRRTVVISPGSPKEFVHECRRTMIGAASI